MSEMITAAVILGSLALMAWMFYRMGRKSWTYSEAYERGVDCGIEVGRRVERLWQERYHQPPGWLIEQAQECQEAHWPGDCILCGATP